MGRSNQWNRQRLRLWGRYQMQSSAGWPELLCVPAGARTVPPQLSVHVCVYLLRWWLRLLLRDELR